MLNNRPHCKITTKLCYLSTKNSHIPTKTLQNLHKNKSWFGNKEQELRHSCDWPAEAGQVRPWVPPSPFQSLLWSWLPTEPPRLREKRNRQTEPDSGYFSENVCCRNVPLYRYTSFEILIRMMMSTFAWLCKSICLYFEAEQCNGLERLPLRWKYWI